MRMHRTMLPVLMLALSALARPALAADVREVEGRGEAAILSGDEATAKEKAKQAALRDAVEKTLGAYIVSDTQTKDFMLVRDQILQTSAGYVSGYEVLETRRDGEAFVVRVRAKVGAGKLDQDLAAKGLLVRQMKYPRMAVLIAEQHIGEASPSAWWSQQGGGQTPGQTITVSTRLAENTLMNEWAGAGFTFVDMEALASKLRVANPVSTEPSADQVREIANLSDADVVIVGSAVASKAGDLATLMNDRTGDIAMTSCKAAVTARVFNADSGEVLATVSLSRTDLNIDVLECDRRATVKAAKAAAAELQTKLLEAWRQRIGGASRVRMSVRGVDSFTTLRQLKAALEAMRGVSSVDQKSFANGAADLDLRVEGGDTETLAGDLEALGGKVKLRVVSLTSNTIAVEVAK